MHQSSSVYSIVNALMQRTPIVPDGERAAGPMKPALKLGL
jgi:hypothetical protein